MQRNYPNLCPASLWALAHCVNKQRFTFGTAIGTDNLRCARDFKLRFEEYLRVQKSVNPDEYEVVTIASCTGHSFVITREIPEGDLGHSRMDTCSQSPHRIGCGTKPLGAYASLSQS